MSAEENGDDPVPTIFVVRKITADSTWKDVGEKALEAVVTLAHKNGWNVEEIDSIPHKVDPKIPFLVNLCFYGVQYCSKDQTHDGFKEDLSSPFFLGYIERCMLDCMRQSSCKKIYLGDTQMNELPPSIDRDEIEEARFCFYRPNPYYDS